MINHCARLITYRKLSQVLFTINIQHQLVIYAQHGHRVIRAAIVGRVGPTRLRMYRTQFTNKTYHKLGAGHICPVIFLCAIPHQLRMIINCNYMSESKNQLQMIINCNYMSESKNQLRMIINCKNSYQMTQNRAELIISSTRHEAYFISKKVKKNYALLLTIKMGSWYCIFIDNHKTNTICFAPEKQENTRWLYIK
mgnify:CR=1 FL=1